MFEGESDINLTSSHLTKISIFTSLGITNTTRSSPGPLNHSRAVDMSQKRKEQQLGDSKRRKWQPYEKRHGFINIYLAV